MSKKLKVAMIGLGGVSRRHAPGWQTSPDADLVAGCDIDDGALAKWGQEHDVGRLYSRLDDLLADGEIDVIDVCTPNMTHAEIAIAALGAGKHVLCEKPLAPTPSEIRRMIAARDQSGKELMTAQHFRFVGPSAVMKNEIDGGTLGDVYHARAWMLRRNAYVPSPTFVHKENSGGGACIDIGVHVLDLTLWLMGNPKPVTVSGVARTELALQPGQFSVIRPGTPMAPNWDVEEFASAFVRFENGATLVLEVSWLLHHDTPKEDMRIWLYGTEGGCQWPEASFIHTDLENQQHHSRTLSFGEVGNPHAAECAAFAQALAENRPSPVPPEQSLHVLSILDGIYRSQEEGREVRLDG